MYKWCTILFCFSFGFCWSQDELLLLSSWKDNTIVDTIGFKNPYNEVWGFVIDGREYGVIGSVKGTHIIDITRPREAMEIAFISGQDSLRNPITVAVPFLSFAPDSRASAMGDVGVATSPDVNSDNAHASTPQTTTETHCHDPQHAPG